MLHIESFKKKIDQSLDGLKDATNRYRTVFLLYNLAAVLIFVILFNQEYSWQNNINYHDRPYEINTERVGIEKGEASFSLLRQHYADMYFERQFFTVPLLGIKCSGSDLSIYAPIAMLIFSTWFFFSARRENHTLLEISADFKKVKSKIDEDNEGRNEWKLLLHYIYSGCIQRFVLITASKNDYTDNKDELAYYTNRIARPVLVILLWMPLLILLFVLYTDIIGEIKEWPLMERHVKELLKLDAFLALNCLIIAYQIYCTKRIVSNTTHTLEEMRKITKEASYDYIV